MRGWDYVIVGAGSAGCLLANRLSADPACRVLLLEAGGEGRNFWLRLPVGYFRSIYDPRHTWQFETEPQPASGDRRIVWPRGRVLGGSSAINGLVYLRGLHSDFDDWARLGAAGWSYREVLPHFRRCERYQGPAGEYHGTDGELGVSELRNDHPGCEAWLQAAEQAGFESTADFNGAQDHGIGRFQLTLQGHWRSSSASAFLAPARGRPNLGVITGARATQLIVERGRARGVRYVQDGQVHEVQAEQEVILSAGALQSPQLLMLSGIGPADALRRLGLPVHADRPEVGRNLQDHYQARCIVRLAQPISMNDQVRNPLALAHMGAQWLFGQRGPLTVGAGQVGGIVATEAASRAPQGERGRPDALILVMPLSVDKPGDPLHRFSGFSAAVTQCRPLSRGRVELASADALAAPRITTNYLTEPHDLAVLVAGLKTLRHVYQQAAFARLLARGDDAEYMPGVAALNDAALEQFARHKGGTVFHPCGTCRMGGDEGSVVDSALRVRGVERLRVIDASVMPRMVSTNINAATVMIAEKAASLLLRGTAPTAT